MTNNLNINIVIPVYNSAQTLHELVDRIAKTMVTYQYTLILVDDGSKDASWEKLEEIKSIHQKTVVAIRLARNFGQHNALICGFGFCKGDVVITMDDDLQHPPEEIPKLIEKYMERNPDLVYGEYINRQQDLISATGSYIFSKSSNIVADKVGRGSSFRLMRADIVKKLCENHRQNFYFIDEVISWYTSYIEFVPVEHHPRKVGVSGYTKRKKMLTYFDTMINYSAAPLKWMTYIGIAGSVTTFLIGMYFIVKRLFFSVSVEGFTATIVTILFTSSVILLCFGIIGQYMYRILQYQNRKPPFSIKKIV